MLSLLKIQNVALIDGLEIEFGSGLNLLTGETGSGKSIIVDSLGALTGERVSVDLIKEGADSARIEGLFLIRNSSAICGIFDESGIEADESEEAELIVRREISTAGRNRIFVNNQLVTAGFLKKLGPYLVDIHGQGEQASLFDPALHLEILDEYAAVSGLRDKTGRAYQEWRAKKIELDKLKQDEAEKLQLVDILRFQVDEIRRAELKPEEAEELDAEKRRLNNVEKLSMLSDEAYSLLYEMDGSTVGTLEQAARKIEELGGYESKFREFNEGLQTAQAVLEDLAITVRDFRNKLEFSPERLEEIENRLAETSRIARKYGGTVETALAHLDASEKRLENIETAEVLERELTRELNLARQDYLIAAGELSKDRQRAAGRFEKDVKANLRSVALEKAKFEVRFAPSSESGSPGVAAEKCFTSKGFDLIEFYFSANVGESPKQLGKVASGGESSRLMLILKTTARIRDKGKTAVFDEIDAGIGGRVAEAVGLKLKELAAGQQVLCVTHQPQVAAQADHHFIVEKTMGKSRTTISVRRIDEAERVEEIARMLAGETVTEAARENARELLGLRDAEKSMSRKI